MQRFNLTAADYTLVLSQRKAKKTAGEAEDSKEMYCPRADECRNSSPCSMSDEYADCVFKYQ